MNKKLILYFLVLAIINFSNCNKKKEVKNINLSEPAEKIETKIPQDAINVGIGAIVSPKEGFLYYKELLDYISKKISKPIVLKQGRYEEINRLLKSNQIDLAFICSGAYVELQKAAQVELLVAPLVNNKPEYYSYIIVHRDSEIENFSDLKGKSFAFVDPLSNSGYLFPVYLVAKKGKTYQNYFSRTIFTYSHDNSIIAVAEKLIDAAAVDSLIYNWLSETNPELVSKTKIILTSPPFGIPPVVVHKNFNLKKEIKKIFLELDKEDEGKKILAKLRIDKFISPDDKIYDFIREMKIKVNELQRLNE